MPPLLYFAYGSNLDADQMRTRCPTARAVSQARLPDHRLAFTHPSRRWRGGSADIVPAAGQAVNAPAAWPVARASGTLADLRPKPPGSLPPATIRAAAAIGVQNPRAHTWARMTDSDYLEKTFDRLFRPAPGLGGRSLLQPPAFTYTCPSARARQL